MALMIKKRTTISPDQMCILITGCNIEVPYLPTTQGMQWDKKTGTVRKITEGLNPPPITST